MNFRFIVNWSFRKDKKIENINNFEMKVYSQNGEDGVLQAIFYKIGTTNKYFVEFGVENGLECNTRYLKEDFGWNGLWMDASYETSEVKKEFVTKDNIERLFNKYNIPKKFDLLSIDIDGNDYWVWKAIKNYNPRVVVIEYNSMFPPPESKVIHYKEDFKNEGTDYFGASLSALAKLGNSKGYQLVGCESEGINAFFVQKKLAKKYFLKRSASKHFRPPKFGEKKDGKYIGYPKDKRNMLKV